MQAPALDTRRHCLLASSMLAGLLVTSVGNAQTPVSPVLPPLPLPSAPLAPIVLPILTIDPQEAASSPSPGPDRSPAAAFPTPLSARSPAEREALRRSRYHELWYGWQTLTADASAVAVLLLGANFKGGLMMPFAIASASIYGLAAPTVHFGHGAVAAGLESMALRVALPLATFALAYLVSADAGWTGDAALRNGGLGALAGVAGAAGADAALLGWDRWQSGDRAARTPSLGVSGSF